MSSWTIPYDEYAQERTHLDTRMVGDKKSHDDPVPSKTKSDFVITRTHARKIGDFVSCENPNDANEAPDRRGGCVFGKRFRLATVLLATKAIL